MSEVCNPGRCCLGPKGWIHNVLTLKQGCCLQKGFQATLVEEGSNSRAAREESPHCFSWSTESPAGTLPLFLVCEKLLPAGEWPQSPAAPPGLREGVQRMKATQLVTDVCEEYVCGKWTPYHCKLPAQQSRRQCQRS